VWLRTLAILAHASLPGSSTSDRHRHRAELPQRIQLLQHLLKDRALAASVGVDVVPQAEQVPVLELAQASDDGVERAGQVLDVLAQPSSRVRERAWSRTALGRVKACPRSRAAGSVARVRQQHLPSSTFGKALGRLGREWRGLKIPVSVVQFRLWAQ